MRSTPVMLGAAISALAALLAFGAGPATAQDATPAATPVADACAADPRPVADFEALIGAPVPATPATFTPPTGEPAPADVVAAVTTTFRGTIACFNATEFLRMAGYYTDAGFREDFGEDAAQFLEITRRGLHLPPDFAISFGELRDVVVLGDGRVGAVVVYDAPGEGRITDYVIFTEANGGYLIDFFVDEYDEAAPATPAATPVA